MKDHLTVMHELKTYASPKARVTRLLKAGKLIQIRRGLFLSSDEKLSPHVLAPVIYGPSYLSFQYALSVHGLVPERVHIFTSATYKKNKDRVFRTPVGEYHYFYLPAGVYPYGISHRTENDMGYLLASPEKALCDSLYKVKTGGEKVDLDTLMYDDWRIDEERLLELDHDFIAFIAPLYRKRLILSFAQWMRGVRR